MPVGQCKHCRHSPVAQDAPVCPVCGGVNPNASRWSVWGGLLVAAVIAYILFGDFKWMANWLMYLGNR